MGNLMQVFLGGMIGSVLRYAIQLYTGSSAMLWIVNIIGSFILGSLNGYFEKKESKFKLFFTTGMLGAFTTFSSFTQQWFRELQEHFLSGIIYAVCMTFLCFTAAFMGYLWNRGNRKWNG
ncbi:fluoride efflux transporter FluC [Lysinibacillus yapensis]|uniref:fluoride efflux transporter FluC n=1 Tax=Ureibacillus yapensis TaxID=2304605 RepID=UPI001314091B|nr:CrcB family protein [Lysinibacillus yapensis]